MSILKPFITSDIVISPFEVNKSFTFQDNDEFTTVGIDRFLGRNITSSLWVSGSHSTGQITTQDEILIYHSIKELYYSNYISGSNGSPAGTASFNPDGTITGPVYTPNYYNYLSNTLPAERYFPTGSNEIIGVISIPSNLFGEYINPGTLSIYFPSSSIDFQDNGLGSLLSGSSKVGDIIYEHGMVIFTDNNLNLNSIINDYSLTVSFQSTVTIYETQYKCTIRQNEFNFSQNPTLISGSSNSGVLYDFATGSYFDPYITTIGLYNNNQELLAVAKLAQPLPISSVTDTNILVNLDL
jgi:hypothetical protein